MNKNDDDEDFMSKIKDLLDLKDEQITDILEKLSSNKLFLLQDAVTRGDKEDALNAIKDVFVDEGENDSDDDGHFKNTKHEKYIRSY